MNKIIALAKNLIEVEHGASTKSISVKRMGILEQRELVFSRGDRNEIKLQLMNAS